MNRIAAEFGDKVSCMTFGCSVDDLKHHSLKLSDVEHVGTISREEVGENFRATDLFIDMSDFQAFGRTAIEAMSCGALAIVPAHGGSREYALDGINCLVVDTRSDDLIIKAVREISAMGDEDKRQMQRQAIQSGFRYSPEAAALSELSVLGL